MEMEKEILDILEMLASECKKLASDIEDTITNMGGYFEKLYNFRIIEEEIKKLKTTLEKRIVNENN